MVSGLATGRAWATARRRVAALSPISTIRASPRSLRWVSAMAGILRAGQQAAGRERHIVLPHEALADQESADAGLVVEPLHVVWVVMPLSETRCTPPGMPGGRVMDVLSVVSKVRRSRLLMPMQRHGEAERAVQLGLVVYLDQRVQPPCAAAVASDLAQCRRRRRRGSEDAVGAEARASATW